MAAPKKSQRPWAIYARLSKAQDGGLEKTEHQIKLCRDHAKRQGYALDDALVFEDPSLSAWKKKVRRPDWDRLMEIAARGEVEGILVYAVDRFTRRPKDLEALIDLADEHGVQIDGPRLGRLDLTTASGRQQARWMALQAAAESDNTSERIKATLGRKMREGKPMGAGRAFGFEIGGQRQRPDEAKVLREVARRMLAGEAANSIVRDLNNRGVRTPRGGLLTQSNLTRLMVRPRNAGLVEHRGEIVGTICDPKTGKPVKPILKPDDYHELVAMVNSRRRGRPNSGRYLLTGIVRCSACNRPMSGTRVLRRQPEPVRLYVCPTQHGGCSRTIRAEATEALVAEHMTSLLADPETMAGVAEKEAALSNDRAEGLAHVDAIEEQLAELEMKFAEGDIIRRAYERSKPVLDRKLAKAQADLAGVGSVSGPRLPVDAAADWAAMTDDQKRALISALVTITIGPNDLGGRYFRPERVVIEAVEA
jgi:DNA invertase Pin-like site-specific DNA recombinase